MEPKKEYPDLEKNQYVQKWLEICPKESVIGDYKHI